MYFCVKCPISVHLFRLKDCEKLELGFRKGGFFWRKGYTTYFSRLSYENNL